MADQRETDLDTAADLQAGQQEVSEVHGDPVETMEEQEVSVHSQREIPNKGTHVENESPSNNIQPTQPEGENTSDNIQVTAPQEIIDEDKIENPLEPRRSQRPRKPTKKARQNQEEEVSKLFWQKYNECKTHILNANHYLDKNLAPDTLNEIIEGLEAKHEIISTAYEAVRDAYEGAPPAAIRQTADRVKRDIDYLISKAQKQMADGETGRRSPTPSKKSSKSKHSKSTRSSKSGASSTFSKRLETAARAAALRAELEAKRVENRQEEELEKMQLEEAKRRSVYEAQLAAESARQEREETARRAKVNAEIERKRREVEKCKLEKMLQIEEAKLKVYGDEDEQRSSSEGSLFIEGEVKGSPTSHHNSQAPAGATRTHKQGLNLHASTYVPYTPKQDFTDIAEALAASVRLSRLPAPEPPVFDGDPLAFPDWDSSFSALIESRGIPSSERIYYLKRYISGPAKEAVSGYFLLKGETAFENAKKVLQERYGSPFAVTEAFRSKLDLWPKIDKRNGKELRRFSDFLQQCRVAMQEIDGLGVLNDSRENKRLLQKLPDWVITRWSRIADNTKRSKGTYPNFSQFADFIAEEARIACDPITSLGALRTTPEKGKERGKETQSKKRPPGANTLAGLTEQVQEGDPKNTKTWCALCKRGSHTLHDCRNFTKKTSAEKQSFIQTNGLCFACLGHGHISKRCKEKSTCKKCNHKHPTCLHEDKRDPRKEDKLSGKPGEQSEDKEKDNPRSAITHGTFLGKPGPVSSMIVPVWLSSEANPNDEHLVYALLDTQSDTTFILEETSNKLGAKSQPTRLKISTMTSTSTVSCKRFSDLQVRGLDSTTKIRLPTTYSRQFIPAHRSHIPTPDTARKWPHLQQLEKRISPMQDCEIGLLIGYNCPQALAPRDFIRGEGDEPFAQQTDLGWSIVGRTSCEVEEDDEIGISHRVISREVPVSVKLNIDESPEAVHYVCRTKIKEVICPKVNDLLEADFPERKYVDKTMSQDIIKFLKVLQDGIHRDQEGYYEMPLPFRNGTPDMPDNKHMARKRLENLKRRLQRDSKYHSDYKEFMDKLLQHGDAEPVPDNEEPDNSWYIPHHGVYHPRKPNKVRVVFDCSATYKNTSLNEHLLQGPDLMNSLVGVLCRFRKAPIAITGDIERYFHMFRVNSEHRDYLRFLWWKDGNLQAEPTAYRMKVHLFGASSSPGCANFALKALANDSREKFGPEVCDFLLNDFYVDDGLKSFETVEEAIKVVGDARKLCAEGNLRLHKFASNNSEVLRSIPESERAKDTTLDMNFDNSSIERVLGVQWCIELDQFEFRLTLHEKCMTRRGILSTVASIYDPLGCLAPFVLVGKQILQLMCKENQGWDEPLSEDLRPRWERWIAQLHKLASIQIPRCLVPENFGKIVCQELHHCSDASFSGYGQCTYLRQINERNEIHCSFVIGKARVAPRKVVTIPRLELTAALVSARMSNMLRNEMSLEGVQEYFWTDSKVILGYINNDARRFHVFVANRVEQIKEMTKPEDWQYINTSENPADLASRGSSAEELATSNWLTGPSFLWDTNLPEKQASETTISMEDPEVKTAIVQAIGTEEKDPILKRLEHFSKWTSVVKALAMLQRMIANKGKANKKPTSEEERHHAEMTVIKRLQREHFAAEIKTLRRTTNSEACLLPKTSHIYKLDPFVDTDGVLRVGGRLNRSSAPYEVKFPAILPKGGHLVQLIVKHYHETIAHQGRGMTTNELRSNGYWIISCSRVVSSFIHKCVTCRKQRGSLQTQRMADLPRERTEPSPPFTHIGIDCFGHFIIKEGRKEFKRYGLLITCMASRAIHIEMLEDMSTDAFINALRCFMALRGPVRSIRCDQGSNFIGAINTLKRGINEIEDEKLKKFLATNHCDFILNSPHSSHMGGAWERQIRTIRSVLTSMLNQNSSRLDTSTLRTFFYEAMSIVNSRPLSVENLNDPKAPEPLTPNHLITMKSKILLPAPGHFVQEDIYTRQRWRKVQLLADQFWLRWKKEYLRTLQCRQKWHKTSRNVAVGDIVLLKDEDLVRGHWRLGRVTEAITDMDNLVRRVKVLVGDPNLTEQGKCRNKRTILERPVHKLIVLIESETIKEKSPCKNSPSTV